MYIYIPVGLLFIHSLYTCMGTLIIIIIIIIYHYLCNYEKVNYIVNLDTCTKVLENYQVNGILGKGGFATVYSGFDKKTHRPVSRSAYNKGSGIFSYLTPKFFTCR